jgi:2-dehydropantoate 2-reductase
MLKPNTFGRSTEMADSYPLPAIFRAPPEEPSASYSPFVSPITADLISQYTIPVIRRTLEEMLAVGG